MEQTELTTEQKETIANLMCSQAVAQNKIQDIEEKVLLDSDLQVMLESASHALHTAKVRLTEVLID